MPCTIPGIRETRRMKQSLGRQAIKESQTPVMLDPHMEETHIWRNQAGKGLGRGGVWAGGPWDRGLCAGEVHLLIT